MSRYTKYKSTTTSIGEGMHDYRSCTTHASNVLKVSDYTLFTPEQAQAVERILREHICELESINADILATVDQFLRDEGYSDEEVGEFLCPWVSKVKEQPR